MIDYKAVNLLSKLFDNPKWYEELQKVFKQVEDITGISKSRLLYENMTATKRTVLMRTVLFVTVMLVNLYFLNTCITLNKGCWR